MDRLNFILVETRTEGTAPQRSRMLSLQLFPVVYVQAAVKNVEEYLAKGDDTNWRLPTKAETPLLTSYRPELDVSPELQPTDAAYYMPLISMLRWIVELGHVDVWMPRVFHAIIISSCWRFQEKVTCSCINCFKSLRT